MSFIKKLFKAFITGPVYLVIFGLIFYGIGAGLTYRQRTFERQGAQAQGEVISLAQNCDDDGCTYSPVVRFKTQGGQTFSFESTYSSSPPSHDVGDTVTVIYSRDNPEKAVIYGEGQVFRIIFMVVGGIVVTLGLGIFASNVRNAFATM
jgi:F0F1-type ATP synthase assembly protein I